MAVGAVEEAVEEAVEVGEVGEVGAVEGEEAVEAVEAEEDHQGMVCLGRSGTRKSPPDSNHLQVVLTVQPDPMDITQAWC